MGVRRSSAGFGLTRSCNRIPSQKLLRFASGILSERTWFDCMIKGSATKSIDVSNESKDIGCSNCKLKNSSAAESQSIGDPGLEEDDENRTRPPSRVSPSNSSSEISRLTLDSDSLVETGRSTTTISSILFLSLLLLFFLTGRGG